MGYWKWLGEIIMCAINLRWVIAVIKNPGVEGAFGGGGCLFGAILVGLYFSGWWWVALIVMGFFLLTHSIYRSSQEL